MKLTRIFFVAMLGILALPAVASAKPHRSRHTHAKKMHLSKHRLKR
ncbi:MAG: hypothetical protein WAK91_18210 [Candidatus Acidiferrales bacterium]|jgi:hypothetical protein